MGIESCGCCTSALLDLWVSCQVPSHKCAHMVLGKYYLRSGSRKPCIIHSHRSVSMPCSHAKKQEARCSPHSYPVPRMGVGDGCSMKKILFIGPQRMHFPGDGHLYSHCAGSKCFSGYNSLSVYFQNYPGRIIFSINLVYFLMWFTSYLKKVNFPFISWLVHHFRFSSGRQFNESGLVFH